MVKAMTRGTTLTVFVIIFLSLEGSLARVDKAAVLGEDASSFLEYYEHRQSLVLDHPYFFEFDPQYWTVYADGRYPTFYCTFLYVTSYVASWLLSAAFFVFETVNAQGNEQYTVRHRKSRVIALFAALANAAFGFTSLMCSQLAEMHEPSRTPCFDRSRAYFSFVWLGLFLIFVGGCFSQRPQPNDPELEKYVMKRQHQKQLLSAEVDDEATKYGIEKSKRRAQSAREAEQMLELIDDDSLDVSDLGVKKSLVLQYVNVNSIGEMHFTFPLGAAIVAMVFYQMYRSCAVDGSGRFRLDDGASPVNLTQLAITSSVSD